MARRERAGTWQWPGLALLVLPTLLLAAYITVLYPALPHLSADLGPSSNQTLGSSSTATASFSSGVLITMGTVGDRIGRRRLLRIGTAIFGLAALLAAYATSPAMVVSARAFWASRGHHAAVHRGTDRNMFEDPSQWTRAIGVWAAILSTELPWPP